MKVKLVSELWEQDVVHCNHATLLCPKAGGIGQAPWSPLITDTVWNQQFVPYSEVSLIQGLLVVGV